MKCHACGTESEFDAAFVKERRIFNKAETARCIRCWTRWHDSRLILYLAVFVAAGIVGFIASRFSPGSALGEGLSRIGLIGFLVILTILPHEFGHALAARLVGWRVHQIVIGVGRSLFQFRYAGILFDIRTIPVTGATWATPQNARWFRSKLFMMVLGGPLANLVLAFVALVLWVFNTPDIDAPMPEWLFLFWMANVWVALVNLLPFESKKGFALPSDGMQILRLLSPLKKNRDQIDAMRYSMEATLCYYNNDTAGLRKWCDAGLAIHPENTILLNLGGIAHIDEQNYDRAREIFLKLLEKEKGTSKTRFLFLNNLAYADALSGRPELLPEADAYSRDALAALPYFPAIVGTRGTVLIALGSYDEGIKLLKKSMQEHHEARSKAENACQISIGLARGNKKEEARKYLDLAAQLDPKCKLLLKSRREIDGDTSLVPETTTAISAM